MTTKHLSEVPGPRPRPIFGWSIHDGGVIAKRHLLQIPRVPELLFFSLIQPVIFVLLFAFVFGGAIPIPGSDNPNAYREYLIPGVFAQTVAFAAAGTTVGLAEDMHKGIVDRFRSLPMAAAGVLLGRSFADVLRTILVLTVLSLAGLAVGWRIRGSFVDAVAAYLLLLLFAYAMIWIGAWIGLKMPSPEVASTAGLAWLFPVTFLSNAFAPVSGMPEWLQPIAVWNPVSSVTLAARHLFGNPTGMVGDSFPEQHAVAVSFGWSVLLLVIFIPLAVRAYRNAAGSR